MVLKSDFLSEWKCLDPPLRYMYIVVQCGLSSIVEDGTTISVVDCVKFSVLVNQCVRPSCNIGCSIYPQKKQKDSRRTVSFLFYETWFCFLMIFIRYFRELAYEPSIYGNGSLKVHQGIIGIIFLRGVASFSMVNAVVLCGPHASVKMAVTFLRTENKIKFMY